jgi:hypothetical protein
MNYAVGAGRARDETGVQCASKLAVRASGTGGAVALSRASRMQHQREKGHAEKDRMPVTSRTPRTIGHV